MRGTVTMLLALALAVGLGFLLGGAPVARAQGPGADEKAAVRGIGVPDPDRIWNFHFEGVKRQGEFLELAALDTPERRGQVLVVTHLALALPQSTRIEVREFYRPGDGGGDGKKKDAPWKSRVRRSDAFSLGWIESTSRNVLAIQSTVVGLRFEAMTRPTLAVTQGGGDIAVYAEGYWADPSGGGRSPATRAPVSGGR